MWIVAVGQTPFEQLFGPMNTFVRQPAPAAVSLLGTIIAFVCLLWSIVNSFWHSPDEDWRPKVMSFLKAFVVVALIAHSGDLTNSIRDAVNQAYNSAGAPGGGIRQVLDDIRENNKAARDNQSRKPPNPTDLWGQMNAAFNDLCYTFGRGLTTAIWVVVWVFRFLQDVFIVILYVLLPLAFGLAVTPWFSNVGTSLISSLVGVLFWPMGFLMVDTFTLQVLKAVLQQLNNWGQNVAAAEGGLSGVFWFLGAMNSVGFGVNLLLIGIVMLSLTAIGYYASVKFITSLFGSAGGVIASGIGAMGKAASTTVALAGGAAALGAGAAAYAAGGLLAGLPSGAPALGAPTTPGATSGANGSIPTGGAPPLTGAFTGLGPQGVSAANPSDSGESKPSGDHGEGVNGGGGRGTQGLGTQNAPAPPRRSLVRLQTAGAMAQRAGLVMMAGGASRTMRQAIKHSAAHALVDGALHHHPTPPRRSLQDLADNGDRKPS